ncbi:hypothetical protein PG995_001133 [Apiospora arundinis]
MGFRDTLRKLAPGSERRDSGTTHDDGGGKSSPEPSSRRPSSQPPPEIPTISLSDETSTKPLITGMRIPASATTGSGTARTRPRQLSDATGKRRPQDTVALVASRPRALSVQTPSRKGEQGEPSPSDYLYFGPKKGEGKQHLHPLRPRQIGFVRASRRLQAAVAKLHRQAAPMIAAFSIRAWPAPDNRWATRI